MINEKATDWSKATLSNSFMFRLVMEKQELCKTLIERILGIKIKSIAYVEAEKSIEAKLASKGIRLDLYVVDEDGVAYDIEMQMDSRYKEFLGRRTRYYVSLLDNDGLKKGDPYSLLRKSYVIFICTFDPFGKGLGKYTFNAICNEDHNLVFDDGVTRVFINTEGDRHRVSKEMAAIMEYISTGRAEDEYTKRLDEEVKSLRRDDGKEGLYMTYQQTIMEHEILARREGLEQGIAQGIERGIAQGMERGLERGIAQGLERGLEQAKIKNVLRMFNLHFSLEDIALVNDISIEQVESIISQPVVPC